MSKEKFQVIAIIIFIVMVLCFSIWWTFAQWEECRNMDFSIFYCIKHIL